MKIETLKNFVQSANINFLIGSGLSTPFLPTLGNIEKQLADIKSLPKDKRKGVTATLYLEFFKKIIEPNLMRGAMSDKYWKALSNYKEFLTVWNAILHNRHSSLRSKLANIYSTNIDLMLENAVEAVDVEFNDGFIGSVKPIFNEANFQKTIRKESIHFQNSTELPLFNLMKMHGSVNWKSFEETIINDYDLSQVDEVCRILDEYDDGTFPEYCENNTDIAKQVDGDQDYSKFLTAYQQFQIVNPTKRKFSETVLDVHFYELMRMFSNSLEKENSLLFVMGFSFADEHIRSIVKRALKTNPTLLVVIFSYSDEEEKYFQSLFENSYSNLAIVTPSSYNAENTEDGEDKVDCFDFKSINKVFNRLLNLIPARLGNVR